MSIFLSHNWQILNILVPIIASIVIILVRNIIIARHIFRAAAGILLLLVLFVPNADNSYFLGGHEAPIGIEFRIDILTRHVIIYLNLILMLFCINLSLFARGLEEGISDKLKHMLYSIILLAHAGLVGIASTADIFNLYVFIEISSLAIYTLISLGKSRHAVVAALDYLIVGTISATFILVAIGMLYAITGTLNMEDMRDLIRENRDSRLFAAGSFIFIIGVITKLAVFPLHSWLIKSYRHTAPHILTYISATSVVIGFYAILKFIYSVSGPELFSAIGMYDILSLLAIVGMISGAYIGQKTLHFKDIILYSSIVQMGYILLMLSSSQNISAILQYIFADGIMKFIFFTYLSLEEKHRQNYIDSYMMIYGIISNIGLPISIGFFNKINLFVTLIEKDYHISFIATIIASTIAISYNFRLIGSVTSDMQESKFDIKQNYALILPTILGFSLIFYGKLW